MRVLCAFLFFGVYWILFYPVIIGYSTRYIIGIYRNWCAVWTHYLFF